MVLVAVKRMVVKSAFTAWLLPLVSCICGSVFAETFVVNTFDDPVGASCVAGQQGPCSLRAAIVQANLQAGTDTIDLGQGTYRILIPGLLEDLGATGDFDISQSLIVHGAGRLLTVIDGKQLDRIFDIKNSFISNINI